MFLGVGFFLGTPVEHPERGPGSTGHAYFTDGGDAVFFVAVKRKPKTEKSPFI